MNPVLPIAPGGTRQTLTVGKTLMQMIVRLEPGTVLPSHKHVHEQATFIVSGKLKLTVDGKLIVLNAGESINLPSNAEHGATADEPTVVLDTFTPLRDDLLEKDRAART